MMKTTDSLRHSRYIDFSRAEWARLRDDTPLTLSEAELEELRGLNEPVSLDEVEALYLPLARLIELYADAAASLYRATETFLGHHVPPVPYIVGIAGSVAVGKSTTARIMQALLARRRAGAHVDLITTDGFLYPNATLIARALLERKGFPESYDVRRLLNFLSAVKAGEPVVSAPVYSHLRYDIVHDQQQLVRSPFILIVEGLNVLQTGTSGPTTAPRLFVSDFFDFSIYVDADEQHIARWYVERFQRLRQTAFRDPASYFHRYADLTQEEAVTTASRIWRSINALNLRENIHPTRERAHLILHKGPDHGVDHVRLRKM